MSSGIPSVTVEKRKWSGSVSASWEADLLVAEDGLLVWRTPAGTSRAHPALGRSERVARTEVSIAAAEWWVASAYLGDGPRPMGWKIDAAMPAELHDGRVSFVDLDLDVLVDDGAPAGRVVDRAVFERRAARFAYPDEICRGAEQGIAATLRRLSRGDWPFGARATADLMTSRSQSA